MKRHRALLWLVLLLLAFLAGVATHALWPQPAHEYVFLAPAVARLDLDEFAQAQAQYRTYYAPLREDLVAIIPPDADVAVYFEDLTTGGWVGIDEREPYRGASLLKIVAMTAVLRAVGDGTLTLETRVPLAPEDRDGRFGALYRAQANATFTIDELLIATATASDNTASNALRAATGLDAWWESFQGLGLPTIPLAENVTYVVVSAKGYSNALRNLYYSGYLRRRHSEYLLSLLAHTQFPQGLASGVPLGVPVAHKIGVYTVPGDASQKQYHDCGIVYAQRPYLLCVLTRGVPEADAKRLIEDVSRTTYAYSQGAQSLKEPS